jgi:hypothetical protein
MRLPSACSVSLLECGCGPRSFNVFKIWVCRLSGLEVILSMHDMARGGLQVSLVGKNRFESCLRLIPLIRRFEDPDYWEPEWAPTLLFIASQASFDREQICY